MNEQQRKTQEQEQLAAHGAAEGQCPSCRSYRADGLPPLLHRSDCAYGSALTHGTMHVTRVKLTPEQIAENRERVERILKEKP